MTPLDALLIMAMFATFAGITWLITRSQTQRTETEAAARTAQFERMLDRFETADAFTAFIATERGKAFVDALAHDRLGLLRRVSSALQRGVVSLSLGAGCFLLTWLADAEFLIPAVLLSVFGTGLVASAGVHYWMLRAVPDLPRTP